MLRLQRERGALGGHLERGQKDDQSDSRRNDPTSHIGNLKETNPKYGDFSIHQLIMHLYRGLSGLEEPV